MNAAAAQAHAKAALLAHELLAGLPIFVECDEALTAEQLAAQDAAFEAALLTRGLAVIILVPYAVKLDQAERGGLHMDLLTPVVVCENPEVNRAVADPTATPPRTPAGLLPSAAVDAAIAALLKARFRFPAQPMGRPEFGDGYTARFILAAMRHEVRAQS